jgi:outer membrane biogenesis lipoprotein LolB
MVFVAGCGARRLALPTDSGTPLPEFADIHMRVSEVCRGVRTLTGELTLSGRAGDDRVPRVNVESGFKQPALMRLDMRGPLGPTVATLAANGKSTTLILNRERRYVTGVRASEILGAMIGVTLEPPDLQAMLTGCVVPSPKPTAGRRHENGWASIDLEGGAVVYLQPVGQTGWRVRAGRRDEWRVEYPEWSEGASFPQKLVLRSEMPVRVEITASVSDVETNANLNDDPFTVQPPKDFAPLTIEELREAGPLGSQ